jgi:hypothetical protein
MHKMKLRTQTFNMNEPEERKHYEEILNNPLCSIIEKIKEKLKETTFEGETQHVTERLMFIVTWQEKSLF